VEHPVLARSRVIAAALAGGVLLLTALGAVVELPGTLGFLAGPAALFGLVGLLIGYRLYHWLRERIPAGASEEARQARFVQATIAALAVTDAVAVFGVVVYWFSGDPFALVGVVTHVILVGAVWPTPERLEEFLRAPPDRPETP
jgi:xanthosine utilization system XapX-like protein